MTAQLQRGMLWLLLLSRFSRDSVQPHRRQPPRLPRPRDSPGKNTGGGCHILLQCMKVKSESEVTQSCPTLHDSMNCSLPGSSVLGILQARVLERVAIAFSVKEVYTPQIHTPVFIVLLFTITKIGKQPKCNNF